MALKCLVVGEKKVPGLEPTYGKKASHPSIVLCRQAYKALTGGPATLRRPTNAIYKPMRDLLFHPGPQRIFYWTDLFDNSGTLNRSVLRKIMSKEYDYVLLLGRNVANAVPGSRCIPRLMEIGFPGGYNESRNVPILAEIFGKTPLLRTGISRVMRKVEAEARLGKRRKKIGG